MLSVSKFLIAVYVCVDDLLLAVLRGQRLRRRGVPPKLSDAEVITMEIVGEVLGLDGDKAIWNYFRQHWLHYFPNLPSRSRFVRQAADLCHVKQLIHQHLVAAMGIMGRVVHVIDAFPMRVCRLARARRCRLFPGEAALGYCASQKEHYFGMKGHLLVDDAGRIQTLLMTPANTDDRVHLLGIAANIRGVLIGDKGYIDLKKWQRLWQQGVQLKTPMRKNMKPRPAATSTKGQRKRRKVVETVISQLQTRFNIGTIKARDTWHLTSRVARKVLAHTMLCLINDLLSREPLHHDGLISIS